MLNLLVCILLVVKSNAHHIVDYYFSRSHRLHIRDPFGSMALICSRMNVCWVAWKYLWKWPRNVIPCGQIYPCCCDHYYFELIMLSCMPMTLKQMIK